MIRKTFFRILPLSVLIAALALSSCAPLVEALIKPVNTPAPPPTPVVSVEQGNVDNPDTFVDTATFVPALLQALNARDANKLQAWMTEPFLTGGWTADLSDTPPADAVKDLLAEQLSAQPRLAVVKDADLKALLGGIDPLSIPRSDSGVTDAVLVSGWGKDGRDEAVLFIARLADDRVMWHGWMVVKGGFSGGLPYQNDAFGFRLYLPKDFEAAAPTGNEVMFLGPGAGHPTDNRVGVFLFTELAGGRTAEQLATQAAEEAKTLMQGSYSGGVTAFGMGGETAYSVSGLPGQDMNRQVFTVHKDVLYKLMFVPDNPQASAYAQMEDAYWMIVNTFLFTK